MRRVGLIEEQEEEGCRTGVAGGSLADNSVTKAADMRESQQGTVGFLFFTRAEIRRGSAKSPASSPADKDFIVCRCDRIH